MQGVENRAEQLYLLEEMQQDALTVRLSNAEQPPLFSEDKKGAIDMNHLKAAVAKLAKAGRAPKTQVAWAHDWGQFSQWCEKAALDPLPASTETVRLYIGSLDERRISPVTMRRQMSTITQYHKAAGLPTPIGPGTAELIRNVPRSRKIKSHAKTALTTDELRAISRKLASNPIPMNIRDRAVMVFGLASAMRRSELCALDLADVQLSKKGITVHIGKSKRDQEAKGQEIYVYPGKRAASCPLKTLKAWLALRGKWEGPLFCTIKPRRQELSKRRMGGTVVNKVVKKCVRMIGLDPTKYGGHSLRAGMVTAGLDAGVSELVIMRRTRHKNVATLQRYDRPKPFAFDPLAKAM